MSIVPGTYDAPGLFSTTHATPICAESCCVRIRISTPTEPPGAHGTMKRFDPIFGRIKARGLGYWADPGRKEKGRINRHFGGRGVYFLDPSGHLLEIITKPYGSGG